MTHEEKLIKKLISENRHPDYILEDFVRTLKQNELLATTTETAIDGLIEKWEKEFRKYPRICWCQAIIEDLKAL